MYRFYIQKDQISNNKIVVTGTDVNHIKNVLRMKKSEKIIICDGQGKDYYCIIEKVAKEEIIVNIQDIINTETELPVKLYLFQGIPKRDKMELIIQKSVELGVYGIIPVFTKRSVVKFEDNKKERKRIERWQTIAAAAAKQSNRGIIPIVENIMSYTEAIEYAKNLDYNLIAYEDAEQIKETKQAINEAINTKSIGIFIGPEGGFEQIEIENAQKIGIKPITLGKRILRTETAGIVLLSLLMYQIELMT